MSFDEEFVCMLKTYPDAVADKKKFSAFLKDYFHGQNMQINLLCAVYDLGIVPDLQKTTAITNTLLRKVVCQMGRCPLWKPPQQTGAMHPAGSIAPFVVSSPFHGLRVVPCKLT